MHYKFGGLIALVIIVGVGVFFFLKNDTTSVPENTLSGNNETETKTMLDEKRTESEHRNVKVMYTNEGFSPKTVEITMGDSVEFVNENSARDMWVGSNLHPTHSLYPEKSPKDCLGSSFDTCTTISVGSSWTFTFNERGDWGYHNHVYPGHRGNIIVK